MSVKLQIGQMSCLEYAAMVGYADILRALVDNSKNYTMLKKYFTMDGWYTMLCMANI